MVSGWNCSAMPIRVMCRWHFSWQQPLQDSLICNQPCPWSQIRQICGVFATCWHSDFSMNCAHFSCQLLCSLKSIALLLVTNKHAFACQSYAYSTVTRCVFCSIGWKWGGKSYVFGAESDISASFSTLQMDFWRYVFSYFIIFNCSFHCHFF